MFGKGGGPLNVWIKEFCELVFIQTLQAFIFAVVISFVVNLSASNILVDNDRNVAYGIICIVAFTSIFKVEEIARRIFGYGPTKADHGNAIQSIGKGMRAIHMGKHLLDNGRKIVGGAGAFIGAHGQKIKAQKRMQSRLNALELDNNGIQEANSPRLKVGMSDNSSAGGNKESNSNNVKKIDSAKRDQKIQLLNDAKKARELATKEKDENKKKALIAEAKSKLAEAKSIDDTLVEPKPTVSKGDTVNTSSNSNFGSGSASGSGSSNYRKGNIKDYNQKKLQIQEEYDNKKNEIKKQKRQGLKQMTSGIVESGAALVGFTAGTAMSVASTNDWGDALKDGISWAGTADAVAAGAVDLGFSGEEFIENRLRNARELVGEYGKNVGEAYKNYVSEMENVDKQITEDTQRQLDDIKDTAERAARNANANRNSNSKTTKKAPSTKRGAAFRAVGKGFKTTVASHSVTAQQKIINDTIDRLDKMNASGRAYDIDRNLYN